MAYFLILERADLELYYLNFVLVGGPFIARSDVNGLDGSGAKGLRDELSIVERWLFLIISSILIVDGLITVGYNVS